MEEEKLFGYTKEDIIDICLKSPFPGNKKWVADNPIWDCFLPRHPSPKDAWKDEKYITKAVNNLFYILNKSINENKYEDFVLHHKDAFFESQLGNHRPLLEKVLARFTIAKIAPKVTALKKEDMLKIIVDTGYDLSTGVYCPMAGFGGIVRASEQWLSDHRLDINRVESYDINPTFVKYYNFTGVRDIMENVITTNKTVIVCPPFGTEYEHWKDTPDKYADIPFVEWYKIIKKQIKAPQYIIIGPEVGGKEDIKCGLFKKHIGIQRWTDEMIYK